MLKLYNKINILYLITLQKSQILNYMVALSYKEKEDVKCQKFY